MCGELVNTDIFIPSRQILGNTLISFLLTVGLMLLPYQCREHRFWFNWDQGNIASSHAYYTMQGRAGKVLGRRLRKVTMYLSVAISLSALAFVSPATAIEKRTSPSLYLVGDSTMALHGVSQGIQGCVFGNNHL